MEGCAEREHGGYEVDDALVVSEELRDVETHRGEEDDVEDADDCGGAHGLLLSTTNIFLLAEYLPL